MIWKKVYFIKPVGLDGPIKIGSSHIPEERLMELARWSPWPLELVGYVPGDLQDERWLHSCFADLHSHREWFHSALRLREAIRDILDAGSLDAVRGRLQPVGRHPSTPRCRLLDPKERIVRVGSPGWFGDAA